MELGGIFILLIVLIVLAVLGGGVYVISMWLRGEKLHPEEDKLEGGADDGQQQPEHVRVKTGQHARFVGPR